MIDPPSLRPARSLRPRACSFKPRVALPARGFLIAISAIRRSCPEMPRSPLSDVGEPTMTIVCRPCRRRARYAVADMDRWRRLRVVA